MLNDFWDDLRNLQTKYADVIESEINRLTHIESTLIANLMQCGASEEDAREMLKDGSCKSWVDFLREYFDNKRTLHTTEKSDV